MTFVLIWEFVVPEMRIPTFETAYANDGPWASLFAKASGFEGTELLADADHPGRYLTIDRWESEADFATFKRDYSAEYAALDVQLEGLASTETRIGAFSG